MPKPFGINIESLLTARSLWIRWDVGPIRWRSDSNKKTNLHHIFLVPTSVVNKCHKCENRFFALNTYVDWNQWSFLNYYLLLVLFKLLDKPTQLRGHCRSANQIKNNVGVNDITLALTRIFQEYSKSPIGIKYFCIFVMCRSWGMRLQSGYSWFQIVICIIISVTTASLYLWATVQIVRDLIITVVKTGSDITAFVQASLVGN